MNKNLATILIKKEAKRLGFLSCGIAKADFLQQEASRLEKWLNGQMQGQQMMGGMNEPMAANESGGLFGSTW
jgi:epoxyqueuosine reductase QueG